MLQNNSVSLDNDKALFEYFSGFGEVIDPDEAKKEYFEKNFLR